MSDNILYELGVKFNFLSLIPFIIFVIFLSLSIILPKIPIISKNKQAAEASKKLSLILSLLTLAVTFVISVGDVCDYKTLMEMSSDGKMLVTSGTVEDYTLNVDGSEEFNIGGLRFKFDPTKFDYGYNVSVNSEGVISNGKNLKLGYAVYKGELKILYIEQLPEEN